MLLAFFFFFFFSSWCFSPLEGRGKGGAAALHLPARMLTFFFCGGVPAFCGGCFSKRSCASYHLGAEMAVGELSHEGELLGLGSLEKVLFHSFYGSHIVFQQSVNENHSQLAHIHTTRCISSQKILSMILLETYFNLKNNI